ncbi:MAG: DoxX protein, partial [Alistipes sp.]|nr:DoxX protein [Alistipes sp.]
MVTVKTKIGWADVARVLFGLTFIFSGFVKTVDPWGTALKITEYLNVYGFETLAGYRFGFAIWFCAAELMMGLMMVFRIKTRLISIFALLIMTFFLVVTFLSATVLPVEDCGCFGDALRLSAWGSFGKNVVLWVLALVVWRDARRRLTFFLVTMREWVCTLLFAGLAGGLGTYCYRHLPLIDFLPYKKGVNLYEARFGADETAADERMIFRDLRDGGTREFPASDTT